MKKKPYRDDKETKPSLVPPIGATIASLLLPGLGQILTRNVRRGLLIIFSMATILGLTVWRFKVVARFDVEPMAIFQKAIHLQPILIIVITLFVFLYFWVALDAYFSASGKGVAPASLLTLILVTFFTLGWQLSDINPLELVTGVKNATPAFLRVIWPWEEAVTYPEDIYSGSGFIQIPCTDEIVPATTPLEDLPYIIVTPTCGELSTLEGSEALGRLDGTAIHLEGYNFLPGVDGIVWWMDPNRQTFRQRESGDFVYVIPDEEGSFQTDITMPYRLIGPSAADEAMMWEVYVEQVASVGSPEPSEALLVSAELIIETIFMGMMATFFGVVLAVPVSFFAARNLMGSTSVTLVIYYLVRGLLNIIRSIEPLIWAIIFTIAVGLGPFAGILALTLHSVAALGKLYSESIESIDTGPIEAIQATGANWLQTVLYAVVPQIVPPFVSFTIYRWDINVRMSTIIGLAGGGGIGFVLYQWINKTDYDSAGIAVWFIAITVAILDYVSAEIRARFV